LSGPAASRSASGANFNEFKTGEKAMPNVIHEATSKAPAMSESSVYASIREILADVLCIEKERITPDADIAGDLGAESIDFVDLSFRVEQQFGITFEPEDLRASANGSRRYPVQLVVDFVLAQLAAGAASAN
jgi:acyl carrier protein